MEQNSEKSIENKKGCKGKKKMIKLEVENSQPIDIINCRVLAIIPQENPYSLPKPHITCCGINVSVEFEKEPDSTKEYIAGIVSKGKTVKCWIIKDDNRIPIDIHGGNVGECYFGYINPTIFN